MKSIRLMLSGVVALLLTVGYLANEAAWLQKDPAVYVFKVDQTPVRILAAVLLIGAIGLALVPDKEEVS